MKGPNGFADTVQKRTEGRDKQVHKCSFNGFTETCFPTYIQLIVAQWMKFPNGIASCGAEGGVVLESAYADAEEGGGEDELDERERCSERRKSRRWW